MMNLMVFAYMFGTCPVPGARANRVAFSSTMPAKPTICSQPSAGTCASAGPVDSPVHRRLFCFVYTKQQVVPALCFCICFFISGAHLLFSVYFCVVDCFVFCSVVGELPIRSKSEIVTGRYHLRLRLGGPVLDQGWSSLRTG